MDVLEITALVDHGKDQIVFSAKGDEPAGAHFYKMCGSGNDFVFFNAWEGLPPWATDTTVIQRLCDRRMGIGADGVVYLTKATDPDLAALGMIYLNSDGSRASFCGNAALCTVQLARHLNIVDQSEFSFESDYGRIGGRMHESGAPEIQLPPVTDFKANYELPLGAGELRAGLGTAGVPHLIVLCSDAEEVNVSQRGSFLRSLAALGPDGANVNFISPVVNGGVEGWRMRTFERGVEGETLACGSGAVVSALMARSWSHDGSAGTANEVVIHTSSGLPLVIRTPSHSASEATTSLGGISLRGEGRLVFDGHLRD